MLPTFFHRKDQVTLNQLLNQNQLDLFAPGKDQVNLNQLWTRTDLNQLFELTLTFFKCYQLNCDLENNHTKWFLPILKGNEVVTLKLWFFTALQNMLLSISFENSFNFSLSPSYISSLAWNTLCNDVKNPSTRYANRSETTWNLTCSFSFQWTSCDDTKEYRVDLQSIKTIYFQC